MTDALQWMCRNTEQGTIYLVLLRGMEFVWILIKVILFLKCIPFIISSHQADRGIKSKRRTSQPA